MELVGTYVVAHVLFRLRVRPTHDYGGKHTHMTYIVENQGAEGAAQLGKALGGAVEHPTLVGGGNYEDAHTVGNRWKRGRHCCGTVHRTDILRFIERAFARQSSLRRGLLNDKRHRGLIKSKLYIETIKKNQQNTRIEAKPHTRAAAPRGRPPNCRPWGCRGRRRRRRMCRTR